VLAAVAAIGLVAAPAAGPVALPGAGPAGQVVPVADVTSDSPAPLLPCPHLTPPTIPPTPTTPAHDPATPVMGGPELNTTGLAVSAGVPAPPVTSAMSWVVADLDTGAVLGACDPHLRRRPASVQKLLLAETALPKLDPNQVVEATPADLDLPKDSSAVGLIVGGHYPISSLWYGLLLESGNDAANALARLAGGAGGLPGTVAAMNAEAHRLGADDTHAVTPSGLDAPDQYTSSYDLALIARADFARQDFVQYDTMLRFQWPAQPPQDTKGFQIQNENKLLTNYPGALGGKTGFTDEARHTYVGAAQRNGRRLVVALMGAEIVPARAEGQGETLLNWGFSLPATASVGHLVTADEAASLYKPPSASPNPGVARFGAVSQAGSLSGTVTLSALVALPLLALAVIGLAVIRRGARRR
jgi:D-alanyl-D-alanine carboxypeptidase (penicillin-binding protein 5/6)